MRLRRQASMGGIVLLLIAALQAQAQSPERAAAQSVKPISGKEFQSTATQALQDDDGANPAMLWVGQGEKLWSTPAGAKGEACASCHGDATQSMKGVAARYPKIDARSGTLLNIEGRINECRMRYQQSPAWTYESAPLLSVTAYITLQSRGVPHEVTVDSAAANAFERGRAFFMTRQGQLNVACVQCHDDQVGQKLRGDTISQGQPTGWPAYRLEWQTMGSLHRRLRACSLGVRAEILPFGSPDYLALELYIAWRAKDLPLESPAVRR